MATKSTAKAVEEVVAADAAVETPVEAPVEAVVETPAETPVEAPVEAPAVEAAPKRKPKATLKVEEGFKRYVSTGTHTYPFDIQIKGEILQGQWTRDQGYVEFNVPQALVEGFEKHYHFTSGNLVAAD